MRHVASIMAVVLTGLPIPAGAQGQSHDLVSSFTTPVWVREVTNLAEFGSLETMLRDIDISKDGEVYVAGGYRFARYENDGVQRWMQEGALKERMSDTHQIYAVAVGEDRIYTIEGPPRTSGPGQIAPAGVGIGIYTLEGETIRTLLLGDVHYRYGQWWRGNILGFGLDAAGNIYAAGIYENTLFFGPDTLAAFVPNTSTYADRSRRDVFLISYTSDGDLRWVRRIGGSGFDTIMRFCNENGVSEYTRADIFALDDSGNTYLGGCFSKDAVFGEGQLNEVVLTDEARALASFDAQGELRWAHTVDALGVSGQTHPIHGIGRISPAMLDIAVDVEGNFFVSWFIHASDSYVDYGPVALGDIVFRDPGGSGTFLTKHAPDGAILWARQIVGDSGESISAIVTDASGHVYAGGGFSSSKLRIQGVQLVKSSERVNAFVVRYDGEGNLHWVEHIPGAHSPSIIAMDTGPEGDIYIAGRFNTTLRLGLKEITSMSNGWTSFVARYAASTITASEAVSELPSTTKLTSNYPNPFTHATTIEYALPASGQVRLSVYDVLGREVAILVDGVQHTGKHASVFDATSLPSGNYLYRLEASGQIRTGLMTLMK